jgi:hypothetical protein
MSSSYTNCSVQSEKIHATLLLVKHTESKNYLYIMLKKHWSYKSQWMLIRATEAKAKLAIYLTSIPKQLSLKTEI